MTNSRTRISAAVLSIGLATALAACGSDDPTSPAASGDGDTVIGDLAGNRKAVARWVRETGNTARISA